MPGRVALSAEEIQQALNVVIAFEFETSTARSIDFARQLLTHGADIHAAKINNEPALEWAIQARSKPLAQMLLALGADPERLADDDAQALGVILQQPYRSGAYGRGTQGCIPP